MPCRDGRDEVNFYPVDNPITEARLKTALARLDAATRAACDLLKLMPGYNDAAWDEVSPRTIRWCKEHQKLDKKRKVR